MANIDTSGSDKKGKKNKPQKHILRVDFTPMVDMNMLLITFFMFCTTLSMPQVMDIAMPTKDDTGAKPPVEKASKTITVLLGENNKLYYYAGLPNYEDYTALKETDIDGLRGLLTERNEESIAMVRELRLKLKQHQITDAEFKQRVSEVKKEKADVTVLIKPMQNSIYKNLVDVLDEMQICSVGRYTIVDIAPEDIYMFDNYESKGQLTAERF